VREIRSMIVQTKLVRLPENKYFSQD